MSPYENCILKSFIIVAFYVCASSALNCFQCNNRFGGVPNTCVSPKNMTGCIGCLKTLTKVKLRDSGYMDGWEKLSVVVSRVCMRPGSTFIKPAGCYRQQNNGGYTERCFCFTDNCNSKANTLATGRTLVSWIALLTILSSLTFGHWQSLLHTL
ncbi:uncharacterized protein LOC106058768 [Biomphalaria glabrata]|uniref:Uncharacterized protein LOC106058768 n=1 Tax=Biomphalaria glabrata TaxID=6526 RepID=A0A9U8E4S8_BIOGL|nr:uncharacterized protein LOC106058768 [Biomphalaria glabrata]